MSQVLIVIAIVYGAILNLLAKPWSSTESMLERRRNDVVAIFLWLSLLIIAIATVRSGIAATGTDRAFDLQDWTALVLPFALAAPYLLELAATLVRQIEMWRWMRSATIHALPIAWLYRTMTVGENDGDGLWFRDRNWDPWHIPTQHLNITSNLSSFWMCTSRNATLYRLFRRWLVVLLSATSYMRKQIAHASAKAHYWRAAQTTVALIFVVLLTAFTAVLFLLSFSEISLLLTFDYLWWVHCRAKGILVARYDTVHFGRQEMQSIFEHSLEIKDSLIVFEGLSLNAVHNRIMAAVITTTAVLENSFRRAYLAVPVYEFPISNRKALREKYSYVGCNLDRLIKQVRILLEMRHTSGLLSITSSTGTIEASLHNNIESILSVAIYFKSAVLYNIVSRIAHFESLIEERIASNPNLTGEAITRERVVYIDARNAMFWILWILVTKEWHDPHAFWAAKTVDKLDEEEAEKVRLEFPDSKTDVLYVIATFLSRCRYCDRYGFQNEQEFYPEVRAIGIAHGKDSIEQEFDTLSACLEKHRSLTLLDWAAREYKISWVNSDRSNGPLRCTWEDDAGAAMQAQCQIVLL